MLVLLLCTMLTPSVSGADTQSTRQQASRDLASADIATRRAAAGQLGEVGRMTDVAALVKALRDRDEETRAIAEAAIWEIWGRSGDAEIDELYQKGLQLMNFGAAGEAIKVFTIIIGKKPEFAEGWNKRATAYFLIGEMRKSLADCDQVMKRNPQHFGALSGYGQIYVHLEEYDKAIDSFRRALAVNPNLTNLEGVIRELEGLARQKRGRMI